MTAHVVAFPHHRRLEVERTRERLSLWHSLLEGRAPSTQKRLLVDSALHGFLGGRDAELLIAELGLVEV